MADKIVLKGRLVESVNREDYGQNSYFLTLGDGSVLYSDTGIGEMATGKGYKPGEEVELEVSVIPRK